MKEMMKNRHYVTSTLFCLLFSSCSFSYWFIEFDTTEQHRLKDGDQNYVLNLSGSGIGINMPKHANLTQLDCFSGKPLLDVRKIMITHQGNPVPFKIKAYNEHGKKKRVKTTMVLPEHHLLYLRLKTDTQVKDSDEICITEADFPFEGDTLSFKTLYRTHSRWEYISPYLIKNDTTICDDKGLPIVEESLQFSRVVNRYRLYFKGVYSGIPVKRAKSLEKALRKKDKDVIYLIGDTVRYELSSSDLQLYDYDSFCKGKDIHQIRNRYDAFFGSYYPAYFLIVSDKNRELTEDDQLIILPGNLLIYHGKPLITEPIRLSLCPKHDGEK